VSSKKGLQLKTSIREDTTLYFPVWNNGTKEAMLMHVMATLDVIKKHGHFQDYKTARALYVAKKEAAKQAKASPALLEGASDGTDKSKKSSKKAKEAKAMTEASDQEMQANFHADRECQRPDIASTDKMFAFYANML
jgi:hypothetical protein